MLSIHFSTPLVGTARCERIKQMTNNHPAIEKSRKSQEILVKIQTSLRRMPGVSSKESNEIIPQLQELGQIVSTEMSQLVDALMNLTLDQEDTDKAIVRMSIENSLAKAEANDHAHRMSNLRFEMANEKGKRQVAEVGVIRVMDELQKLSREFMSLKNRDRDGSLDGSAQSPDSDNTMKLEDAIKHLEDQANSCRSRWIMKSPIPRFVARAIENIGDPCPDKDAVQTPILSLHPDGREETVFGESKHSSSKEVAAQPGQPPSTSQSSRPPNNVPTRFGYDIGPDPSCPSSTAPNERHSGQWAPPTPVQSQPRFGPSPASGSGYQSSFNRNVPHRGFNSGGAYRTSAPESYAQLYGDPSKDSAAKSSGGYDQRREYHPPIPFSSRNKYIRLHDTVNTPDYTTPSGAPTMCPPFSSPLIHVTDMTITAWHDQFMDMYAAICRFVNQYANSPAVINLGDLSSTRLWPALLAAYSPLSERQMVSYLAVHLNDETFKCCLVARIIVDHVVNRVWVPRAWMGAERHSTYGLKEVEKEFKKTQGQPAARRQRILDRQASIIESIHKLDGFREFSRLRCRGISEAIVNVIEPLLNRNADPEETWTELVEDVSSAAWALSSRILSSRLTFDFHFPKIGSRYLFQSMLSLWPNVEPQKLHSEHWRVALVTTPVVTVRSDIGAKMSAHSVFLACVVCMR